MKHALILCFLIPLAIWGLKVDLSVNKYTLSTSDQLELTLKVSDADRVNVSEPQPPKIPLFSFRNMTSGSSSSVSLNGTRLSSDYAQTYKYIYLPTGTGSTTIPSLSVTVNNRSYKTKPIVITVVKGVSKSPGQSAPPVPGFDPFAWGEPDVWGQQSGISDDTRLIAMPETQSVYRGFPAIVSYYLYTDSMVRSFNLEGETDFSGYGKSTYEQPSALNYETVQWGGKSYKRALIKRLAIMPNSEGSLQAPQLSGVARLYNYGYLNKTLQSTGGKIVVRPLPKTNVPDGFSGAVGNFTVSHSISKPTLSLGEALSFTLKIAGKGNFNQFSAPLFAGGQGFQVSSPMVMDNLNAGIEGTRTYYYTLIPQDKGTFPLPELKFVWFAHDAGSYQIYRSPKQSIQVTGGHVLSYLNRLWEPRQLRSMFPKLVRTKYPVYKPMARQPWYWLLVFVILAGTVIVAALALDKKLKTTSPERYAKKKADKVLQHYMKHAVAAAQNLSPQFYPLAEKALLDYLAAKYKLANHLSTQEKLLALQELQIPPDLLADLQDFLNTCLSASYAPENDRAINLQNDLQTAKRILNAFVRLNRKNPVGGLLP